MRFRTLFDGIAGTVTFQPKEKTYTDAELEALMNMVISEVGKKTELYCDKNSD